MKKSTNKGTRVTLAQAIRKSKPSDVRLHRENWDFSECPSDHLDECFFYEFFRECPNALRAAPALREHLKEIGTDTGPSHRSEATFADLLNDYPEFPDAPFLRIPTAERTRRIAKLDEVIPPVQADLGDLVRQYKAKAPKGKTIKYLHGDIAAFFIAWGTSDEKLVQGFRHWLKSNRPPGALATIRKGKGSSHAQYRKDLKALGALRLLKQLSWEDAYTYTREILQNKKGQPQALFGSHANAWRRARKNAEKMRDDICFLLERQINLISRSDNRTDC